MRVGFNPNKDKELQTSDYFHQIIIPVYIPHQREYFQDSLQILEYCLESIFLTVNAKTYVTVVNNGSCTEVVNYLNTLYSKGKIHEVIHTSAIGKLNAVFKGLSGHAFSLITIADSDVLFVQGWQKATYDIYENFPKAGAVCPVPSAKSFNYYTANIIGEKLFSQTLKFTKVKDPDGLIAFAKSIDNPNFYNNAHLSTYLTITNSKLKAVVGAAHFVCTYRGEIFSDRSENYSGFSMGGDSEGRFLDKAVVKKGLWRLATEDNFAFHLGNMVEDWMPSQMKKLEQDCTEAEKLNLADLDDVSLLTRISSFIVQKIMDRKKLRNLILQYKGLPKSDCKNY